MQWEFGADSNRKALMLAKLAVLSVVVFGISMLSTSLYLDVVVIEYEGELGILTGYDAVITGWLGPLAGHVGWYANLIVPLSWPFSFWRNPLIQRISFALAVVGFLLGVSSYMTFYFWPISFGLDVGGGEIRYTDFVEFEWGIHVWMLFVSSGVAASAVSIFGTLRSKPWRTELPPVSGAPAAPAFRRASMQDQPAPSKFEHPSVKGRAI